MAAVFLSYSREDRAFAEFLARFVEQAGHDVWWDRDIDGGSEFSGEIEAALEKAEAVLVAWSRSSAKSAWVRDEAAIGRDSGRLVPIVIDGSQPPMGFRQYQALDLTGWKGGKKDPRTIALLRAIDKRAKGRASPSIAAEPKRTFAPQPSKRLWIVAAAIFLIIGVAGTALFIFSGRGQGDHTGKPTMALLPFTASSSDPQLRELAGQARDALSHTLSQSAMPARLLDSVPADRSAAGDFLISGEMSRSADKIVATVRLDEAAHGVTVFSKRLEADPQQVPDFPERIGAQIAGVLSNRSILRILDRRHPVDPALMTELLAGEGADDPLQDYQNAKRVVAKAPDLPSAQIAKAIFTGLVLDQLPADERPGAVVEARRAADKGLQLAPDFGDTYLAWCLLHSETLRVECEDHLRAGNRVDPDAPYLTGVLAELLRSVGRFDEAVDVMRLNYVHDRYDNGKIGTTLRTLEATDNSAEASKIYVQGIRWWPDYRPNFSRERVYGMIDRGDFDAIRRFEQEVGFDALGPNYRPSTAIAAAVKSKSIPALRTACDKSNFTGEGVFILVARCMMAFSIVGDMDSAYAIADKVYQRRLGRTAAETESIWLNDPHNAPPLDLITSGAAAGMRRDPRYLALAQRVGLLDYWRSGRPPDFCRKSPEPICPQLRARH